MATTQYQKCFYPLSPSPIPHGALLSRYRIGNRLVKCVYPVSFSLSRGDILFILITVSSLLPSITDPSHMSPPNPLSPLIHTHCSTFLSLVSPVPSPPGKGDTATSLWQESLPLNHYGIRAYHGNNTIPEMLLSNVSLPYPSWSTVIKV